MGGIIRSINDDDDDGEVGEEMKMEKISNQAST